MSKENNLTDFLTDVADAIREKKGTTDKINPQDFSDEIKGIKTSSSMWTGHVDVEGLKAIGWDDEDIAYYQEYGVNWMTEDDAYHKVSDDNKALYGAVTADNYKEYADRIVYLPKLDKKIAPYSAFTGFKNLVGIPLNVFKEGDYRYYYTFNNCHQLYYTPPLGTLKPRRMNSTFRGCFSLVNIPYIDTSEVEEFIGCFYRCYSLLAVSGLDFTSSTDINLLFGDNFSIKTLGIIDTKGLNVDLLITGCHSLINVKIKNLAYNLTTPSATISKESIIYVIENEAATSAITITLRAEAYTRWANDPDILAALAAHPLVSLASA